jgi:hypothetical protein
VENTRPRNLDNNRQEQKKSLLPAVIALAITTQETILVDNKQKLVLTLLDTGAQFTVIDPSLALRLRLPVAEIALPKAPA